MFGSAKVFAVPRPIIRKFLLPNPRHHVKDKYPFRNSTIPNFPGVPFLLRRAILKQAGETNGLSYIYE